ncbi:HD domain-containing protein [Glycomyces buryatensis]|uniref:HD domain-containing protein n=2 Tax=Glycomyces buryatensis TaxID=2570927 RepID=A0A4S8QAI8_9ACTN|nr:HD domain-containing protein [Glycomyces buryatensis]
MDRATLDDWMHVGRELRKEQAGVGPAILAMLSSLESRVSGFAVNQLNHALQTATRAERAGADDEVVISALCHDIGKVISVPNHPAIGAEILRPYVREECYWVLRTHQDFQGRHYYGLLGRNPDERDKYRDEPWYDLAVQFTDEWDQTSFDPEYEVYPLDHFRDRVLDVFAEPRHFPRVLVGLVTDEEEEAQP